MYAQKLYELAETLQETCLKNNLKISVAESCTGGMIGGLITAIPGSSEIFGRGFITYNNQAKGELLGVPAHIFMVHGAVSSECASAMAEGALEKTSATLSVAATGIAGPGGATDTKPVGLVYVAVARTGHDTLCERYEFTGDRAEVRMQAVESAIMLLTKAASR